MKYLIVAGALYAGLLATAAQAAEDSKPNNTQMCVRLSTIIDEWVIDDQTIVINQGGGIYKRVDVAECPSLRTGARSITYDTPNHEFCAADQIRTSGPNGPLCVINQITSISAAEAKELKTKIH